MNQEDTPGKRAKYIHTHQWSVDPQAPAQQLEEDLKEAADLLIQNEVIGFPTETVYGLGGNARSCEAISKIFAAKGRPSDNPLIVHVATMEMFSDIAVYTHPLVKKR